MIFQAIIYGLIQGIAEFLPISSTAHLILIPYFLHWQDPGLSFDVFLHLGTLVAIILFFAKDWLGIFKGTYCHPALDAGSINKMDSRFRGNDKVC